MSKGSPSAATIATAKYQKKVGYRNVSFKMKGDIPDQFAAACEKAGRSKASVIAELMQRFIDEQKTS